MVQAPWYFSSALRLPDGRVVVAGGFGSAGYLADAEMFDAATGAWSPVATMSTERYLASTAVLLDGHILVAGGFGNAGILNSVETYDPCPSVHTGCSSNADCDDGDACTTDTCNADGSCGHAAVSCDDGDSCTLDSCDLQGGCQHAAQCPDCSAAAASVAQLWPPNHKLVPVGVGGVTDPQGQPLTITVDGIWQDEPTDALGDGDTCPDAAGVGTSTAQVRAERSGTPRTPGDGRVYHLAFTATDPDGHRCSGAVTTCVPHDQGGHSTCLDEGPLYNSLVCGP